MIAEVGRCGLDDMILLFCKKQTDVTCKLADRMKLQNNHRFKTRLTPQTDVHV